MSERRRDPRPGLLVSWFTVALLGVAVWLNLQQGRDLREVRGGLNLLIEHRRIEMTTLQSSWKGADGVTHEVTTPQEAGEDPAAHAARHQAAVEALKAIYPPA